MGKRYIAKINNLYLQGEDTTSDIEEADIFESETEPRQRINQMKKDGKLNKKAKVTIKALEESKNKLFKNVFKESSGDMSLEQYCDSVNSDANYIEAFRDWVRKGIHGKDILSRSRWDEIWDDFGGTFYDDEEEEEVTEFKVDVDGEKPLKVWKDGGKWKCSDGSTYMSYLKPADVVHWLRKDYGKAWLVESRLKERVLDYDTWDKYYDEGIEAYLAGKTLSEAPITGNAWFSEAWEEGWKHAKDCDEEDIRRAEAEEYWEEYSSMQESKLKKSKIKESTVYYREDDFDFTIHDPNEDAFDNLVADYEAMKVDQKELDALGLDITNSLHGPYGIYSSGNGLPDVILNDFETPLRAKPYRYKISIYQTQESGEDLYNDIYDYLLQKIDPIQESKLTERNKLSEAKSPEYQAHLDALWEEGYQAYYDGEGYADYPTGLTHAEAQEWMCGWDAANEEDSAEHSPIRESSIRDSYNSILEDIRDYIIMCNDSEDRFSGKKSFNLSKELFIKNLSKTYMIHIKHIEEWFSEVEAELAKEGHSFWWQKLQESKIKDLYTNLTEELRKFIISEDAMDNFSGFDSYEFAKEEFFEKLSDKYMVTVDCIEELFSEIEYELAHEDEDIQFYESKVGRPRQRIKEDALDDPDIDTSQTFEGEDLKYLQEYQNSVLEILKDVTISELEERGFKKTKYSSEDGYNFYSGGLFHKKVAEPGEKIVFTIGIGEYGKIRVNGINYSAKDLANMICKAVDDYAPLLKIDIYDVYQDSNRGIDNGRWKISLCHNVPEDVFEGY